MAVILAICLVIWATNLLKERKIRYCSHLSTQIYVFNFNCSPLQHLSLEENNHMVPWPVQVKLFMSDSYLSLFCLLKCLLWRQSPNCFYSIKIAQALALSNWQETNREKHLITWSKTCLNVAFLYMCYTNCLGKNQLIFFLS